MKAIHRVLATSLLILLIALLATACGGSSDSTATGSSNDSTGSKYVKMNDDGTGASAVTDKDVKELKKTLEAITNTIESCAASNTDGSYTGCTDAARLFDEEPSLRSLEGRFTVKALGSDHSGYEVTLDQGAAKYTETHDPDGTITRSCSPDDAPGCTNGHW